MMDSVWLLAVVVVVAAGLLVGWTSNHKIVRLSAVLANGDCLNKNVDE